MDMVAMKRVKYPHGPSGREYQPGEAFSALSERDAKALFITGKAKYGAPAKSPSDLPAEVMQRALTAEPEAPKPEPAVEVAETAPKPQTYHRRDMTAEPAGQTGKAKSAPSSRPAPRRKGRN